MPTKTKTEEVFWNLASIWNQVALKENRELKPRDYIYASEVGSPLCDRFLKMNAVPFTNPPNNRSLRKFLAGNLMEFVVKSILIAAGIYKHDEVKVDAQPYADCLEVHGRLDFVAGGYIDEELAYRHLTALNLPDYLTVIGQKIIDAYCGQELVKRILELKAVSTFAMDKVERTNRAIANHSLQAYHYQKNGGIAAAICYVCKDDCRMAQFNVYENEAEPLYRKDLEQITYYYRKGEQPPKEPLAKFDDGLGKFSKNLGVEYSPYLTMLYNFETPDDYRAAVTYIDSWNRTLARYVQAETGGKTPTGKPIVITPKNKEARASIEAAGYNFDDCLECKIRIGATEEEVEE